MYFQKEYFPGVIGNVADMKWVFTLSRLVLLNIFPLRIPLDIFMIAETASPSTPRTKSIKLCLYSTSPYFMQISCLNVICTIVKEK